MFKADRIFSLKRNSMGITEWYFLAREGIMGPYATKEEASRKLALFLQWCIEQQQTGGRTLVNNPGAKTEPEPEPEPA